MIRNQFPALKRIHNRKSLILWGGHFYAIRATEVLGLLEKRGVTRMRISAYNVEKEIDRTLEVMGKL